MPNPRVRALALGLLALAVGGCSFRLAMPPPPPATWPRAPTHGSPEERCTPSPLPPVADTVAFVVLNGIAFLERDTAIRATPIIFSLASIPVAISAIYGYVVTAECRHYRSLFDAP